MTTTRTGFSNELGRYSQMARRAAASYIPNQETSRYLVAPATDYLARGGKGLRPALCLATCEAFGGTVDDALGSAAALELFHTAFLIHDDVEDGSELRRGKPTLHRSFGRALAINAGDGLAVFALGALKGNQRRLGRRLAARVWSEFDFMALQTVEGQAIELGWQRDGRTDLTPDDYLDMIMKKTCWYTTVLPLRVGALIGTQGAVDPTPMVRFGFFLGAAFQIRDDILNLTGSPDLYGKEARGDLREGKRTLMLLHLLTAADPIHRHQLERYLATDPHFRSDALIEEVFALMQEHGSVEFANEFAQGIARSAAVAFEEAFVDVGDSPARRFVKGLIAYMVERDR